MLLRASAMLACLFMVSACSAQTTQTTLTEQDVIANQQSVIVKLFGAGVGSLDSYGTGLLVSKEGHVLTVWNHLVSTGYLTAVTLDGKKFPVETLGTSSEYDVALLKLKTQPGESFPFVDLAQAVDPAPGSSILAFSNMFKVAAGNEPVTVVHGVIAAKIPLEATQGRWKFPVRSPVWLIDAITNNSGSAGGLLTDLEGRPVGLIGREIRHAASRQWVNYAVPLTTLKPVVETLLAGKKVDTKPKDGDSTAMLSDQDLTVRYGLTLLPNVVERTPAYVDAVEPGSQAESGGFRRGDLIVLLGDTVVTGVSDVQRRMAEFRQGEKMVFTVNRDQELVTVELRAVTPKTTSPAGAK